jgi:hypothetical protein
MPRSLPRSPLAVAAALLAASLLGSIAQAGQVSTWCAAEGAASIRVNWTWYEDPSNPTARPDWVGYDLYRTPTSVCGDAVRLNAEIIPRVVGQTHDFTFLDTTPATATAYVYSVKLVDADRNILYMIHPDCEWPCSAPAYSEVPALSAPYMEGTVADWGWAAFVQGCAGCWGSFYVSGPVGQQLRAYANTGQVVRLWGQPGCGSTEGCGMQVDHYELLGLCGATPARHETWGSLKSRYH